MDPISPETTTKWLIIGAYIFPFILNLSTFIWQTMKDRRDFKKKEAELEQQDDLENDKLSLEWAKEFRARLAEVESFNARLSTELNALRTQNIELSSKVKSLEETNRKLESELSKLQFENTGLTTRVKELEGENRTLKERIEKLQLGGSNGLQYND